LTLVRWSPVEDDGPAAEPQGALERRHEVTCAEPVKAKKRERLDDALGHPGVGLEESTTCVEHLAPAHSAGGADLSAPASDGAGGSSGSRQLWSA
jgi:hypothetical protein